MLGKPDQANDRSKESDRDPYAIMTATGQPRELPRGRLRELPVRGRAGICARPADVIQHVARMNRSLCLQCNCVLPSRLPEKHRFVVLSLFRGSFAGVAIQETELGAEEHYDVLEVIGQCVWPVKREHVTDGSVGNDGQALRDFCPSLPLCSDKRIM